MADNATGLIRPNYFDRQQLTAADLNAEQQYFRERLRRHNRFLHGWGVVSGAEVARGDTPGVLHVSEGYVVTPHGDEIYIPAGTQVDVSDELDACLGAAADPCSAVRISGAVIDPKGKDDRTDYNAEWIELLVQERMSLDGYVVQHTINPGTPREGVEEYYTFHETKKFPFGTVIRIHSGAARHHDDPESGILHRYRASPQQVGNWRLNNVRDTIRILNPEGVVVHTRTFASDAAQAGEGATTAYLIVCPCEQPICPKPLMPEPCQPPGGAYEWSRAREIFRLQLICELPFSHQMPLPNCESLDAFICGRANGTFAAHVPPPPNFDPHDNGVVLATVSIQDGAISAVDDVAQRRQLLSDELRLAYLRCQCRVAPPVADFIAEPDSGSAPLDVSFLDESTGQITSWAWSFGDGGTSSQQHPRHTYQSPGTYTVMLTVTGPGGSDTASRAVTARVAPPIAAFSAIPRIGWMPLTVTFTDQSSGAITNRLWAFGDGSSSSAQNPVHTYLTPGNHLVTLTITGPGGTDVVTRTVIVLIQVGFVVPNAEPPAIMLDDDAFDLVRGVEVPVERINGIAEVRGGLLRDAGADNVVALAALPPERTAEIAGVNVETATRWRDEAREMLRR